MLTPVNNGDGTYTLTPIPAHQVMPSLNTETASLMDGALRRGEIGTDDAHIFSSSGGTRLLSRAISTKYGGADSLAASVTIESVERAIVVAAVPQMTLVANHAGANAIMGRLGASNLGGSLLTVDTGGTVGTGMAAGDGFDMHYAKPGFGMWIMPLYQNWSGFGLEGGNYEMDAHGALGGVALGADYTFGNALRAGITVNMGGGYVEGSGDFHSSTNNLTFWGAGLYAGWAPGAFGLFAEVNFTSTYNSIAQELPASMQMGNLEADVNSWALTAGLRAQYTFVTDWLNITLHAGFRFSHLKTEAYDMESSGLTVLEGDAVHQDIWSFPVGVTFAKSFTLDNNWYVKPSLDLRVTPNAGDINARGDVRFTGVSDLSSMKSQTMDYLTYGGTAGLEFGRDNIKIGLNYNLEAGEHSTQHGVFITFRYEF